MLFRSAPSALAITDGSPPSNTATQLFVVPKSIPTALAIICYSLYFCSFLLEFLPEHLATVLAIGHQSLGGSGRYLCNLLVVVNIPSPGGFN